MVVRYKLAQDDDGRVFAQAQMTADQVLEYRRQSIPADDGYLGVQVLELKNTKAAGGLEHMAMVVTEDRNPLGLPRPGTTTRFFLYGGDLHERPPAQLMQAMSTPAIKKLSDLMSEYERALH